jgi:hypothetical protein
MDADRLKHDVLIICFHSTVFFHHLGLIAFSFAQGNIRVLKFNYIKCYTFLSCVSINLLNLNLLSLGVRVSVQYIVP